MSVKKYTVLNRINHDNADYEIGSAIELEDDQAVPLLKVNVIAASEVIENPSAPEGEARVAAIQAAIAKIDASDAGAWAKDGKPKTEAIAAITGWSVSAAERNEVWESVKPAAPAVEVNAAEVNGLSANATTETAA